MGVMREALREMDRAVDRVRAAQESATTRRLQAVRQQYMFRAQILAMGEKARCAMAGGCDDHAEAALSRQYDFELQAEHLEAEQAEAAEEANRLSKCLAALCARKAVMEESLARCEAAQRMASLGRTGEDLLDHCGDRWAARAADAYGRATAGCVAGAACAEAQNPVSVADLIALQRTALIASRLASLRASDSA